MIHRLPGYSRIQTSTPYIEESLIKREPIVHPSAEPSSSLRTTTHASYIVVGPSRDITSPYLNYPANKIIPRRRYVILPAGSTNPSPVKTKYPYIPVVRKPTENSARRIIRTTTDSFEAKRSLISSLNTSQDSQAIRRGVKRPMLLNRELSSQRYMSPLCPIPTVPASMSMGGEYVEDEENYDEDSLSGPDQSLTPDFGLSDVVKTEEADITDFVCPEPNCFWRGPNDAALNFHTYTVHTKMMNVVQSTKKSVMSNKPAGKPKGVRCSECDVLAYSRPLLLKHMESVHCIEAPLINRMFDSRDELQKWLVELRTTHAVEFVVSSGSKKWGFGLQVHYLTCSRSGDQKERPNKKNARPPRPSIKCGKNCMAYLKIKQNPVTSVLQIEGCLHHSGHTIDGNFIKLSPSEWDAVTTIAHQLEANMINLVLEDIDCIREILGRSGRFRLIPDDNLLQLLHKWITELRCNSMKTSTSSSPVPLSPDDIHLGISSDEHELTDYHSLTGLTDDFSVFEGPLSSFTPENS